MTWRAVAGSMRKLIAVNDENEGCISFATCFFAHFGKLRSMIDQLKASMVGSPFNSDFLGSFSGFVAVELLGFQPPNPRPAELRLLKPEEDAPSITLWPVFQWSRRHVPSGCMYIGR